MANKTVQILGQGYGTNPCTATAIFDGQTVFSGPIPTVDQPVDRNLEVPLFNFDVPIETTGNFPMSITFTGEYLWVQGVSSTNLVIPNPKYTQSDLDILNNPTITRADKVNQVYAVKASPAFSSAEINFLSTALLPQQQAEFMDLLYSHDAAPLSSTGSEFATINTIQAKTQVYINGVLQPAAPNAPPQGPGQWGYLVPPVDGNTGQIVFELFLPSGVLPV